MSHTIGPLGGVSQLSTDAVLNCQTFGTQWYGNPYDAEAAAIAQVSHQLSLLAPQARARVLAYLQARFSAG